MVEHPHYVKKTFKSLCNICTLLNFDRLLSLTNIYCSFTTAFSLIIAICHDSVESVHSALVVTHLSPLAKVLHPNICYDLNWEGGSFVANGFQCGILTNWCALFPSIPSATNHYKFQQNVLFSPMLHANCTLQFDQTRYVTI